MLSWYFLHSDSTSSEYVFANSSSDDNQFPIQAKKGSSSNHIQVKKGFSSTHVHVLAQKGNHTRPRLCRKFDRDIVLGLAANLSWDFIGNKTFGIRKPIGLGAVASSQRKGKKGDGLGAGTLAFVVFGSL